VAVVYNIHLRYKYSLEKNTISYVRKLYCCLQEVFQMVQTKPSAVYHETRFTLSLFCVYYHWTMNIVLLYHKNNTVIPQDMSSQFMSCHIWGAWKSNHFSTCKAIFIHTSSLLLTNWLLFLAPLLGSHRFLTHFKCTECHGILSVWTQQQNLGAMLFSSLFLISIILYWLNLEEFLCILYIINMPHDFYTFSL